MSQPLVLLSNDDGYLAPGIQALAEALRARFQVVVCAPSAEQSASSHSLSLHRPLRLQKHDDGVFSVDGTPADSVYLALHEPMVLPRAPNLVVSGMNHGLNLGQDVFYSGTVAAAREGALQGAPSLAFSAHEDANMTATTKDACEIVWDLWQSRPPKSCLLNINYPPGSSWKKRATISGRRNYTGGLDIRSDPRGRRYYWIGGNTVEHEGKAGTDTRAFDAGEVGITQLTLSLSLELDTQEASPYWQDLTDSSA